MKNTIIHATWPFVGLKTRQSTILLTAFSANNGLLEVYKKGCSQHWVNSYSKSAKDIIDFRFSNLVYCSEL